MFNCLKKETTWQGTNTEGKKKQFQVHKDCSDRTSFLFPTTHRGCKVCRRGQWSCCLLLLLMLSSLSLESLLLLLQQLHFPYRCIMDLRKFPLDSQVGSSHQKLLKISALTILISFWIESVSQALFPFQDKISLPASFYPSFETYNSYFSHFWKIQVIFTKFSIYSISIYFEMLSFSENTSCIFQVLENEKVFKILPPLSPNVGHIWTLWSRQIMFSTINRGGPDKKFHVFLLIPLLWSIIRHFL